MKAPKNIWNWVLQHPALAGLLAAISLATAFSPKVSETATWIFIAVGVLFAIAMLQGIAEKLRWRKRWLVIGGVASVVLLIGYGCWLTGTKIQKPYCYAVFYRSMGPDGSVVGGKEVLGLVEEIKDLPATDVTVTAQDWTGHPTEFDPKMLRRDLLRVVYPYFTGMHSPCRITPTAIVYEPRNLGTEYWMTISSGNGEDTQERIQFTKKGQCISFMRLKDQKVYIKNYLSPFDDFGGCLMGPSEMAKNPKSGAEWTIACQAN